MVQATIGSSPIDIGLEVSPKLMFETLHVQMQPLAIQAVGAAHLDNGDSKFVERMRVETVSVDVVHGR